MASGVAVVIPALNEAATIEETIASAFAAGADEVVVADGGSADATREVASVAGARVISGERVRGSQLNEGARATSAPVLLFLHADTVLPANGCDVVRRTIDGGASFGGFRIAFRERSLRLRMVAAVINLRCALTREPWGDQGQFVTRSAFEDAGGFRAWPIMEDYEFARRMKSRGATRIIPLAVRTSGRRFLARGILRTTITNWRIIAAYERGVPVEQLAAMYRA